MDTLKETFLRIYLNNISLRLLDQHLPENARLLAQCHIDGHSQVYETEAVDIGSEDFMKWSMSLYVPFYTAEFSIKIVMEDINTSSRVDVGLVTFETDELLRQFSHSSHIARRIQGEWKGEFSCEVSVSPVISFVLLFRFTLEWIYDIFSARRIPDLENRLTETKSNKLLDPALLISLSCEVYSLSDRQPQKPSLLNLLGDLYWRHYLDSSGDTPRLDEAIRIYAHAAQLATDVDPKKAGYLNDLAAAHLRRFEQLSDIHNLNIAMEKFKVVLDLTQDDDRDKPLRLSNYGNSLSHNFKRTGDEHWINKAIEVQRQAMDIAAARNAQQPFLIHNLATSLDLKFERYGLLADLGESISLHEEAVVSCADGDEKLKYLSTLSNSLYNRFGRKGALDDLDKVITIREEIAQLTKETDRFKPGRLNNLANAYLRRFERHGEVTDLEKSIRMLEKANNLTADEHPDKLSRMNNLASSYIRRYARLNLSLDLDNALVIFEDIVHRTAEGHPERPARLSTLAGALARRFERMDSMIVDIDRAIELEEEAVKLTPDEGAKKASRLSALANFLRRRFERLGNVEDIDRSLSNAEIAVKITPADNPEKYGFLNVLGISLAARFDTLGSVEDINRSISVLRMSVRLTVDIDREKPARLGGLGGALWSRFKRLGDVGDLRESVQAHERAVMLTPKDHPSRALRLNNFGTALTRRFRRLRKLEDIDKSISVKEEALRLLPENHPQRLFILDGLANSLFRRYVMKLRREDIDRSISVHEEALEHTPENHPSRLARLNNLGNSLSNRFEQLKGAEDITRAISLQTDAVKFTLDGHLNKVSYLNNLANSYVRRSTVSGTRDDLENACLYFSLAAKSLTGSAVVRFRACSFWAKYARLIDPSSLLGIYEHAVSLLPQLAWLALPITDRFHHLMEAGRVIRDGASVAIEICDFKTAVEWLEQGRSVIWGQLLQLRSPLDKLHDVRPDLAMKLIQISWQLEGTAVDSQTEMVDSVAESGSKSVDSYHSLALERENLISQVREEVDEFKEFMLPPKFSELTKDLPLWPIAIINVSSIRCDALVISKKSPSPISHIPLPALTLSKAQNMYKFMRLLVTSSGRSIETQLELVTRGTEVVPPGVLDKEEGFEQLLSFIWTLVVKPILTGLELPIVSSSSQLPRLWWCPTGPLSFLPLHAAGVYDIDEPGPPGSKISNYVVSSYTPTLAALQDRNSAGQPKPRMLVIVQPNAEGQRSLPGTEEELKQIKKCVNESIDFDELVGTKATVQKVSEGIKTANWVHFACHGVQDLTNPTQSALLLAGRPSGLTLSKIIGLSLPNAQLAFLSACQTATGDEDLAEESVHLAAAMLLAGYKGVVATLWSIKDRDAPLVAEAVYSHLLTRNSSPDIRDAAHALHNAVTKLRGNPGDKPYQSWVPYVHIGI